MVALAAVRATGADADFLAWHYPQVGGERRGGLEELDAGVVADPVGGRREAGRSGPGVEGVGYGEVGGAESVGE